MKIPTKVLRVKMEKVEESWCQSKEKEIIFVFVFMLRLIQNDSKWRHSEAQVIFHMQAPKVVEMSQIIEHFILLCLYILI